MTLSRIDLTPPDLDLESVIDIHCAQRTRDRKRHGHVLARFDPSLINGSFGADIGHGDTGVVKRAVDPFHDVDLKPGEVAIQQGLIADNKHEHANRLFSLLKGEGGYI
jgi:hypothetical protein